MTPPNFHKLAQENVWKITAWTEAWAIVQEHFFPEHHEEVWDLLVQMSTRLGAHPITRLPIPSPRAPAVI